MEIRINKDLVSHIIIKPLRKSNYIWVDEVKEKKVIFGLLTLVEGSEAGFYENGITSWWSSRFEDEYIKDVTVIDGVIYWNPYLGVFSGGKEIEGKHYKTVEEIYKVCDELFPNVNIVLK